MMKSGLFIRRQVTAQNALTPRPLTDAPPAISATPSEGKRTLRRGLQATGLRRRARWFAGLLLTGLIAGLPARGAGALEQGFRRPPDSARPWVYWFWLNGNITSNGITADLEAMQRVGIGGVLIMEVDQGAPAGPAAFASPRWRNLFKHVVTEAHRLGLEVNMNNDAGWCGSGGPWVRPEQSMQKLVWTETPAKGPRALDVSLPQPKAVAGYYRDIAVLAFPKPVAGARVWEARTKAFFQPPRVVLAAPPSYAPTRPEKAVSRRRVIDLTHQMDRKGRLRWDAPAGDWIILRIGHTSTGQQNHPAPQSGRGLECDKLSASAVEAHFNGLMGRLIDDVGPLAGPTLVSTHIDSWEVGVQNWTPGFRRAFQQRRGYDPLTFLPVCTGRVVDSIELSERFLWDWRQTVSELLLENYAHHFRELAHRRGLRLSIEAYTTCPTDELAYAGRADEPMGEFWSWRKYGAAWSCLEMTSAAHVYGKRIVGAEAFTASNAERWLGHPGNIKDLGDWAFCEGINRFVFHRYALQPWDDVRPGMSMGPWGLHYERTQTWWEQSRAWHTYLARCQFLLRQGRFVADLCLLTPEGAPMTIYGQRAFEKEGKPIPRGGYNFDLCPPEVVLRRMQVRDGRLVLPDGMNYRLLVLPRVPTMTPELLRKIRELVQDGATVVGAPPIASPSLRGYPECDREVRRLAKALWGDAAETLHPPSREAGPERLHKRRVGRGQVLWGGPYKAWRPPDSAARSALHSARWIWRREGNPVVAVPPGKRYFRKLFTVDATSRVTSARWILTADNAFVAWLNGHRCGAGDTYLRTYRMDVTRWLRPGTNLIAVAAENGGSGPNPAALIGVLIVRYQNGRIQTIPTDTSWQVVPQAVTGWNVDPAAAGPWSAAMDLGPLGMEPWGDIEQTAGSHDLFADPEAMGDVLAMLGVPPDFTYHTASGERCLRYIHRRMEDADLYFVANLSPDAQEARCAFRVSGRYPEFWWPETGHIESAGVYAERAGRTYIPVYLAPHESVFVVFRKSPPARTPRVVSVWHDGRLVRQALPPADETQASPKPRKPHETRGLETPGVRITATGPSRLSAEVWEGGRWTLQTASGLKRDFRVAPLPRPLELNESWDVHFQPGWGAPEQVHFDRLISWSQHADAGVRYFSGEAVYRKPFDLPAAWRRPRRRVWLDLGEVAVSAAVRLNGQDLGVLWKRPYRLDITDAVRSGRNSLELRVVNLWINRMIGDEQLPEDSDRHPNGTLKAWPAWLRQGRRSPTGRYTFTTWRLWKKDDPLQPSGLLGPVRVFVSERREVTFE